jgi:hypothetical protein
MSQSVRIPDPVHEKAEELKKEHDFATLGEAIRQMCREGGYDV